MKTEEPFTIIEDLPRTRSGMTPGVMEWAKRYGIIGADPASGDDESVAQVFGVSGPVRTIIFDRRLGVRTEGQSSVRFYGRLTRRDIFGLSNAHVHPSPEAPREPSSRAMVWLLIATGRA